MAATEVTIALLTSVHRLIATLYTYPSQGHMTHPTPYTAKILSPAKGPIVPRVTKKHSNDRIYSRDRSQRKEKEKEGKEGRKRKRKEKRKQGEAEENRITYVLYIVILVRDSFLYIPTFWCPSRKQTLRP